MKSVCLFLFLAVSVSIIQLRLRAADDPGAGTNDDIRWPRSFTVENAEIVLDEPRVEKWQDSVIEARIAVEIKIDGEAQTYLGSFAARAETLINSESRVVTVYNITAHDVKFPDAPGKLEAFTRLINALAPEKPVKVSLDRLLASVPPDDIVTRNTVLTATQNKAPRIFVSNAPSVLLAFDGAPAFRSIPGSGLEAAVNTPATVLRTEGGKSPLYLLTNEGLWLTAQTVQGPWRQAGPPAGLERILADHPVALAVKSVTPPPGAVISVPDVLTSDEPAEMIQIDGKPNYKRIGDLPLVRVGNTDSPLFYHFDLGTFYVLISGRWFSAQELKGPWIYVPHNALPVEFAQIPTDDPSAYVRVSVAGTREAGEAVKEAQLPTEARVNIREAPTIDVDYDGEPIFEEIPGTELQYAVNTSYEVIRIGGLYYCCHDGLWFVADRPFGSRWRCATSLPRAIYTIPPSCPLYHTRFCDIESFADDEVVYRYNAGYFGTYIDPVTRVCIYGTGYRYRPYISDRYYCGHSWTYGLGSNYRPRHGFINESRHVARTNWYHEERRQDRREPEAWRGSSAGRGLSTTDGKWKTMTSEAKPYTRWTSGVTSHHDEVAERLSHKVPAKDKPRVVSHGRADETSASVFRKDPQVIKEKPVTRENRGGEQPAPGKNPELHKAKKDIETPPVKTVHHDDPKPQIPSRQDSRPVKSIQPGEKRYDHVIEPDHSRAQRQEHVEERKPTLREDARPVERKEMQPRTRVVEEPRRVQHDPPKEFKREQPKEQPREKHDTSQPSRGDRGTTNHVDPRSQSHDSKKGDKKDDTRGR
ncbi:MAG: hypothetical protein WCN98_02960 [Verrucomicrobiaceae bacterium]